MHVRVWTLRIVGWQPFVRHHLHPLRNLWPLTWLPFWTFLTPGMIPRFGLCLGFLFRLFWLPASFQKFVKLWCNLIKVIPIPIWGRKRNARQVGLLFVDVMFVPDQWIIIPCWRTLIAARISLAVMICLQFSRAKSISTSHHVNDKNSTRSQKICGCILSDIGQWEQTLFQGSSDTDQLHIVDGSSKLCPDVAVVCILGVLA
jgi:hypothetical protein